MTGLLGGGHAIYFDAASGATRAARLLRRRPVGHGRADGTSCDVPFGEELVRYAVGASSCAVPGVPAGLDALWRAHGRLPWARLVEPALRLARSGVAMPPAHASCLAMLAPVMTMREGAAIYAPGGPLLENGRLAASSRGSSRRSSSSATKAPRPSTADRSRRRSSRSSRERDGVLTRADLESYEARWSAPSEVTFAGRRIATRGGSQRCARDARALRSGGRRRGTARGARRRRSRRRPHDEPHRGRRRRHRRAC